VGLTEMHSCRILPSALLTARGVTEARFAKDSICCSEGSFPGNCPSHVLIKATVVESMGSSVEALLFARSPEADGMVSFLFKTFTGRSFGDSPRSSRRKDASVQSSTCLDAELQSLLVGGNVSEIFRNQGENYLWLS